MKYLWYLVAGVGLYVVAVLLSVALLAWQVQITTTRLFTYQATVAPDWASYGVPVARVIAWPARFIPDVSLILRSEHLTSEFTEHLASIPEQSLLPTHPEELELTPWLPALQVLADTMPEIERSLQNTWVIKHLVSPSLTSMVADTTYVIRSLAPLLAHWGEGSHRWLIVLQNSDELRASGGFMGSYGLLELKHGKLTELVFEDIYDASGQLESVPSPPPGVLEYLSGGEGWQLQDSNWNPDIPTANAFILDLFAQAGKGSFGGSIIINSGLIQHILEVTGPIMVPDYGTVVTADNLTVELRAKRDEFFAGSLQKKHFISLVFSGFFNTLHTLPAQKYPQLITSLAQDMRAGQVILYSRNDALQEHFETMLVAGAIQPERLMPASCDDCRWEMMYVVESNVGINKANRLIERAVDIALTQESTTVTLMSFNNNLEVKETNLGALFDAGRYIKQPDDTHLAYVNYFRVITTPDMEVSEVKVNGELQQVWSEHSVITATGQTWKEVGVLVVTPEQRTSETSITFQRTQPVMPEYLVVYKQPGVAPYQYTVHTPLTSVTGELATGHAVLAVSTQ